MDELLSGGRTDMYIYEHESTKSGGYGSLSQYICPGFSRNAFLKRRLLAEAVLIPLLIRKRHPKATPLTQQRGEGYAENPGLNLYLRPLALKTPSIIGSIKCLRT